MAEQFCNVGNGHEVCFETFGDPSDPALLLTMGLATQMLGWHEDFCGELARRGFHVIRYDNRDVGRSQIMTGRVPSTLQLLRRDRRAASYTLEDMAADGIGVLDHPGFERDHDDLRRIAGMSFDRGINPAGTARQLAAIIHSGDRTPLLRTITAPTLVIHGD